MRQVSSHRRCICQRNVLHVQFTEYSIALSVHYLIDNIFECPMDHAIECYIDRFTEFPSDYFTENCTSVSAGIFVSDGLPEIGKVKGTCARQRSSNLSNCGRIPQGWLLKEKQHGFPWWWLRAFANLAIKSSAWFPGWTTSFPSVPRRGLEWDKLCVVVLGINEYEKLNYWILQCKLYFEHKFFISEC